MSQGLTGYVVVAPQIFGNAAEWTTVYHGDRVVHPTRSQAIQACLEDRGHNDWLLAIVEDGVLVGTAWVDEDRDEPEEAAAIAKLLGLALPPTASDSPAATAGRPHIWA